MIGKKSYPVFAKIKERGRNVSPLRLPALEKNKAYILFSAGGGRETRMCVLGKNNLGKIALVSGGENTSYLSSAENILYRRPEAEKIKKEKKLLSSRQIR